MTRGWLTAWSLAAVAFGGASLIAPLYLVELGGGAFDLGILFATSSFVGVVGALVFGGLADRTGKRRIFVLAAMATTVLTMLLIPALETKLLVIVVHALLWLGFAAATPVLTLLVVGEPESEWSASIARLNKFQGIGWALGLLVGFLVITVGSQAVETITAQRIFFLVCAASAGLGTVLGLRTLPPDPKAGARPTPRQLRRRARNARAFNIRGGAFPFTSGKFDPRRLHPRRLVERFSADLATYFVAVLLVFIGFGAFFAPLPAYLSGAGYGSSAIFALYLALNVAAAAFYGRAAALVTRYDAIPVHIGALLARGAAFPALAAVGAVFGTSTPGAGAVILLFVVIGLSWALIGVTAGTVVTTLAPPSIRGEALGAYGALVALGGGVGGLVGGWLASISFGVTFGVAGGLVVVGAGVVAVMNHRSQPEVVPEAESA